VWVHVVVLGRTVYVRPHHPLVRHAASDGDTIGRHIVDEVLRTPQIDFVRQSKILHAPCFLGAPQPDDGSSLRKTSTIVPLFNLVATVCGGGVLSLLYASPRRDPCHFGLVVDPFGCHGGLFALHYVCLCATHRRSHIWRCCSGRLGPLAEVLRTVILCVLLLGILVAYMVLLKRIWTPMILGVAVLLNILQGFDEDDFGKE
jgi:hypothetical protein